MTMGQSGDQKQQEEAPRQRYCGGHGYDPLPWNSSKVFISRENSTLTYPIPGL